MRIGIQAILRWYQVRKQYLHGLTYALILMGCSYASPGWAQGNCDASVVIPEADRRYRLGNFDEVFSLLKPCLKNGFSPTAQVQAYKIMALTYMAMDSLPQAAENVRYILGINQNYEPEYSALPQFKELVIQQKELQERIIQVTSVSKKAENLLQVPATVTVITSDDILKRGYRDLTQLLNDIPGFDVIRGNGPGYVVFYQRGYRSTGNDRSILLVDGVEENDLQSDNIQISRQYALSDIDRVEIIYGPASTMYGANAFVGVINLITKKVLDREMPEGKKVAFSGTGQLRYAGLNTKLFDGVVTGRTKDIAVSVTARMFTSDEMDLSRYPEWNYDARVPGDYLNRNITGEARVQQYLQSTRLTTLFPQSNLYELEYSPTGVPTAINLTDAGRQKAADLDNKHIFNATINGQPVQYNNYSENWMFRTKVEFSDFTLSILNWKTDEGATPWYTNLSRLTTRDLSRWVWQNRAFSLTYNKYINDKVQLVNLTSYRLHELQGETNLASYRGYYNGSLGIIDLLNERQPTYSVPYWYRVSNQLRNEFRILWTPISKLDINSGVERRNSIIQANYITSLNATPDETGRPDSTLSGGDNFKVMDLGIFTQASYNWTEQFKLVLGARMDYNQIRQSGGYGVVLNPRVAAIYTKGKFVLKGIYAEAFKDASYLQKYATTSERLLNNPTLQPEKVKNVEASIFVRFTKSTSLNLVAYHANYSNAVGVARAVTPTGIQTTQFQALGRRRIMGLQAEGKYESTNVNLWANFTYTNPVDLSSEGGKAIRLSDIADWMCNVGGVYTITKQLNWSVTANYISARKTGAGTSGSSNPITRFDPIFLLNSALTYQNIFKGVSAQIQGSNLLNAEYFVPGTRAAEGVSSASRYPQERRNISISLFFDLH